MVQNVRIFQGMDNGSGEGMLKRISLGEVLLPIKFTQYSCQGGCELQMAVDELMDRTRVLAGDPK